MKAYLSSTYADLVEYRKCAYDALRRTGFDVTAMEHYVAADERPLEKCLADVAAADVYVGLIGFRHGFVPATGNPDGWSITEHEYRRAVELGKRRLLFCVDEKTANWPRQLDDHVTGADRGAGIDRFRAAVTGDRVTGFFDNLDQLDARVTAAAAALLGHRPPVAPAEVPQPRPVRDHLLLWHAPADADLAHRVEVELTAIRYRVVTAPLTARPSAEDLDTMAAGCRAGAVLLSRAALALMAEDDTVADRTLGLVRDRTGVLWGFAREAVAAPPGVFTEVVRPADERRLITEIRRRLLDHAPLDTPPESGLPVMVVAMTGPEADELLADPPAPVRALLGRGGSTAAALRSRYGTERTGWRPFPGVDATVLDVLRGAIDGVNADPVRLRGHAVRLQPYPIDAFMADGTALWAVYERIARQGCLLVIDELSLLHERLDLAFRECPVSSGRQVAMVTIAPLDPAAAAVHADFERELAGRLREAARRFGERLDPLCELGVPEPRRLHRWLHANLPGTLDMLRSAIRDEGRLTRFQEEMGRRPNPALSRLIAGEGGLP